MTPRLELILAYAVSAVLSATSAFVLYRRRNASPGAGSFAFVLGMETLWTLAGIAELQSRTFAAKRFWDDMQLPPAVLVPGEILLFVLAYIGRAPAHPMRTRLALWALPFACMAFVFTDAFHGRARASARIEPSAPFDLLLYDFTSIELLTFTYTYALFAVATALLVRRMLREHRIFRFQTAVALVAMVLPSSLSVFMLFDVRVFGQRDFTPLAFGVSGVLLVGAIGRRRFLDLVPIAHDAVVESVSDAVLLLDARGRFVDLNAAARELVGVPLEDILGAHASEVLPQFDELLASRDGGRPSKVELRFATAHGVRDYEALVTEVHDSPGSLLGTAILLRDITERREAADALRRANDELEARVRERTKQLSEMNEALSEANLSLTTEMAERLRAERERSELELQLQSAQKMESIGRLAGGVAHDFNNLLTAILCNVDLIGRKLANDPKLLALLDPVRQAGESAAGLTRQLLAFSRNQIVEHKPIDLDQSLDRVHRMLERILGEDVELRIEARADGAFLVSDPGQLEQIVVNLAVNARDATEAGGVITLRTERLSVPAATPCADGSVLAPGEYVTLSVADTGTGIPPDVLARVFDPFFTTKPEGRGTGLGLAVVRDVAKQHGGHVDVETEVGRGTTFKVHFPRVEPPLARAADEATTAEPPGGRERILLVEDQALVRDTITRTLERFGYEVTACESARAGLASSEQQSPAFDLLVTDVVLADGSGRKLAESLRERVPTLSVLYVSGYTDDVVLRHGIAQGGLHYLAKPFTERQLANAVRHALDGRNAT